MPSPETAGSAGQDRVTDSAARLPLFNADSRCPKCMGTAAANFMPARGYSSIRYNGEYVGMSHPWFTVTQAEHIKRRCETCRYEWPEACLDS